MKGRASLLALLSIPVVAGDAGSLPSEFRLFAKGWNDTEKGRFLFDDAAAREVISAYEEWGVDLMIDLEHFSLQDGPVADPDQRDARGWAKLEIRDGALWATSVTWTPDGERRLKAKTQRYVSPAFKFDPDSRRVLSIFNVAITSIPATHNTPALVAASRAQYASAGASMDPKLVAKAMDALKNGDAKTALEVLEQMLVAAAGGQSPDPGAAGGDDQPNQGGAPANMAADDGPPSSGPPSSSQKPKAGAEKKSDVAAATARLMHLTNADTFAGALEEVETWRKSHIDLEKERQKLAADRAVLEDADRRKLCAELVTLGAEYPSTVWADPKSTKLKPRWTKMEIAELRAHVAEQRAARGKKKPDDRPGVRPPAVDGEGSAPAELSAADLALCKEYGADPADFAALRARRDGATNTRTGG